MDNPIPHQIHECPRCGWRYPTPIRSQVYCPNHSQGLKSTAQQPLMKVIWDRSHKTEPPSLIKENEE